VLSLIEYAVCQVTGPQLSTVAAASADQLLG